MSKHFEGPLQVGYEFDETGYPLFVVAGLSGDQKRDRTTLDATAKVFAAAPKMLDELKHWVAICPNCGGSGQRMHSFDKCLVPCEKCSPSRTLITMVTG